MKLKTLFALNCFIALTCLVSRADTVIGFDDQANGTFVSGQYTSQGVTLTTGGFSALGDIVTDAAAPSPPNVLDISQHGGEFNRSYIQGYFVDPHHHFVAISAGAKFPGGGLVTLTCYDLANNVVATGHDTVKPTATDEGWLRFSVASPGQDIASFTIDGGYNENIRVEDLAFDTLTGPLLPDFTLQNLSGSLQLAPGGYSGNQNVSSTAYLIVELTRLNGSSGNITYSLSGLPSDVVIQSITPMASTGSGNDVVLVVLAADFAAIPVLNAPVTFTGTPDAGSGGYGAHSFQFNLTVGGTYDARVLNMEVTQGIQSQHLPTRGIEPGTSDLQTSIVYSGVDMAAGKKTLVRVFGELKTPLPNPNNTQLPQINCLLYGYGFDPVTFIFDIPLPGSPLQTASPVSTYPQAWCCSEQVTDQQRQSGDDYRFILPASWTQGSIALQATLVPLSALLPTAKPPAFDCCPNNDTFTMTGIPFYAMLGQIGTIFGGTVNYGSNLWFDSTEMTVNGIPLNDPPVVMAQAIAMMPIGEHQALTPPFDNILDITDIWNHKQKIIFTNGFQGLLVPELDTDRADEVAARFRDKLDDWHLLSGGLPNFTVGIFPTSDPVSMLNNQIRSQEDSGCSGNLLDEDCGVFAIFQDSGRSITSVAHEIGHLLGRPHASPACNPGCSEDWLPDERGLLQGVGFNLATSVVLDSPPNSTAPSLYDFMSYCASSDDSDSWISPKGWEEEIYDLTLGQAGTPPGAKNCTGNDAFDSLTPETPPARVQVADGTMLVVSGITDGTTGRILKVGPATAVIMGSPSSSMCNLIVRDINGTMISSTPMWIETSHADDSPTTGLFYAFVPAAGVASAEVNVNGMLIDKKMRSMNAPMVQITGVQPDMSGLNNHISTMITWTASDADNDPLMAKIDYSTDSGQNWRNVFMGPNSNTVTLPSMLFNASPSAMVRVRISDGFNETTAISDPFTEAGAPPTVTITSPKTGTTIGNEETLHCSGGAFDDQHQVISDANITWYAGKKMIGQGGSISVTGLAPVTQTITMVATDYLGRMGSASVVINVLRMGSFQKTLPDPGLINSNLVLWLSADTQVLTDSNGLVSVWSDLSGLGNDAIQGDTNSQPVLVPNGIPLPGGQMLPAVQFGMGGDQFLTIPSEVLSSQQYTIIAVVNDTGATANSREIFSSYANPAAGEQVLFGVAGVNPTAAEFGRDFITHKAIVHSPERFSVLSAVTGLNSDGVNITTLYQNQQVMATAATPASLMSSLGGPYGIGMLSGIGGDTFWRGNMAEILVYNEALSSSERQQIYQYLQTKYDGLPGTPQFSAQVMGNQLQINFTMEANRPYVVLYADSLDTKPIIWKPLTNFYASSSLASVMATDALSKTQRFYRLQIPAMDLADTNPQPPTVLTLPAAPVATTTASLNGSMFPNGNTSSAWFQYGLDTTYGTMVFAATVAGSNTSPVVVTLPISSLLASTVYHFQLVASNSAGMSYGGDQSFTTATPPPPPVLVTLAASSVTSTSAVLNGTIRGNGSAAVLHFQYGFNTNYSAGQVGTYFTSQNNDVESYSFTLTGLTPNTTYHYRTHGFNCCVEGFGADVTFTTGSGAQPTPTVTTLAATSVSTSGAVLNGSVNPNGSSTTAFYEYGMTTGYGTITTQTGIGTTAQNDFQATLSGLSPSTTYHYRIEANNAGGITYGADLTFTTASVVPLPTVTTLAASSVTTSGAVLNGSVNPNGSSSTAFFEYGTTTGYGTITTQTGIGTTVQNDFQAALSGLSSFTTYHYRMDANNAGGISYGADNTFTTAWVPVPPTLVLPGTATPGSPQMVGTLTPTFNWTGAGPASSLNVVVNHYPSGTSAGVIAASGTSLLCPNGTLAPGMEYEWHMVAYNNLGDLSANSSSLYFQTASAPAVQTLAASNVLSTTAQLKGFVNPNGAGTTAYFEYGTTTSYGTITTQTGIGTTAQNFNANISGLSLNTTYHYRINGVNGIGTTHGADMTFKTQD